MSVLHAITAAVGILALCLYTWRTGKTHYNFSVWEKVTRFGLSGALAFMDAGLVTRAVNGDPFMWYHLGLLACLTIVAGGYLWWLTLQLLGKDSPRKVSTSGRDTSPCAKQDCATQRPTTARSPSPCPSTLSSPTPPAGDSSSAS